VGRSVGRLSGVRNFDLGLMKNFAVSERYKRAFEKLTAMSARRIKRFRDTGGWLTFI